MKFTTIIKNIVLFFLSIIVLNSCSKSSSTPAPTVTFSWQSANTTAPSTVVFTNTSTNAASYAWDFGDGGTSTLTNPTHIYTTGGTYTVKLTATGSGGTSTGSVVITIATPTQLKVKITDNLGSPISGATATLYNNLSDYQSKTNAVATTTTDANGYMYFSSNLSTVAYYFYISSGCLDNYHNANHFSTPLVANTLNTYNNIILSSEGQIQIVSTSTNPYEVFLDGNVIFSSVAGGSTHYINEVPAGSHTVRVLQLSGYVISPTDETFTANVTCGNFTTVTFP